MTIAAPEIVGPPGAVATEPTPGLVSSRAQWDLESLIQVDRSHKPVGWETDWSTQLALYEHRGRSFIQKRCRELKLGIKDDENPTEVDLLRFLVDQLSTVYRAEPTRRLIGADGENLEDDSDQQVIFDEVLKAVGFQSFMRAMERRRVLARQCAVRVYASDKTKQVKLALFGPQSVLRDPDLGEPGDLWADERFALKLAGDLYEVWERRKTGWAMRLFDKNRKPLADELQPLKSADDYASPYGEHPPVVMAFDALCTEGAWLPPKTSWTSYPLNISAKLAGVMSALRWQSHPRMFFEKAGPEVGIRGEQKRPPDAAFPRNVGPNSAGVVPDGYSVNLLSPEVAAAVSAAIEAIMAEIDLFLKEEGLPPGSYAKSQNVTALGIRQLAAPLQERQESIAELAHQTEQRLFRAFWSVHRVHASAWGQPTLAAGLGLGVTFGPLDVPVDTGELIEQTLLDLKGGLMGPVRAYMRRWNVSRSEALRMMKEDQEDREAYQLRPDRDVEVPGEQPPDPDPEQLNPAASTSDAVLAGDEQ